MLKIAIAAVALLAAASSVQASTFYTSEAAFLAGSNATLTQENFEAPTSVTGTSAAFAGVTATCAGTVYCPGFFGVRNLGLGTSGPQTVFFATPDSITFTFSSAINAFGIDVIGLGTVGATNLTMSYSGGSSVLYTAVTGSSSTARFAGLVDTTNAFTSVTFSATQRDDGIDFDRLQYGATTSVPEPGAWALLILGFGALGSQIRARRRVGTLG